MKNFIFLITLIFALSCTSKVKEGSHIGIYNKTESDIFIIDKYDFDGLNGNKIIDIIGYGYQNPKTNEINRYLKFEYITMLTVKDIFFSIEQYKNNKKYTSLIFYIIRKKNLNKTKNEIIKGKLYDSIS